MSVLVITDKDTTLIETMYMPAIKSASLPLQFNYDNVVIVDVEKEKLIFLNTYNGSIEGIIGFVKNRGFKVVLYDIDNKTILYDFVAKQLLSNNGFTSLPKNPVNDIILVRDKENKLWKAWGRFGFPLLAHCINYSSRLSSYKMSEFGKDLYLDLMKQIYSISEATSVNLNFTPNEENLTILNTTYLSSLDKLIDKIPKKHPFRNALVMDMDEFLSLKVIPENSIYIQDKNKLFPPAITEIIYMNGTLLLYYNSRFPPTMPATQITGLLNLDNKVVIKFLQDYKYDDDYTDSYGKFGAY